MECRQSLNSRVCACCLANHCGMPSRCVRRTSPVALHEVPTLDHEVLPAADITNMTLCFMCLSIYIYIYTHRNIHMIICIHNIISISYIYICTCNYTYMHDTYVYIYIYIYIHTYIYIYIHTYRERVSTLDHEVLPRSGRDLGSTYLSI